MQDTDIDKIKIFRHKMRLNGARGACHEVSQFIEHEFGFMAKSGVYECADGRPIFEHRWNIMDDGSILDGTADQFAEGFDVIILKANHQNISHYRPIYTDSFGPKSIDWLKSRSYIGVSDAQWWSENKKIYTDQPGWWLDDIQHYLIWKKFMSETYESFTRKDDFEQIQNLKL